MLPCLKIKQGHPCFTGLYLLRKDIPLDFLSFDTGTHYKYSYEDITQLTAQAEQLVTKVQSLPLPPPPLPSHPHSSTWLTQLTDIWLVHALTQYVIKGKQVVGFFM